jgi:hypothetical protein
VAHHGTMTAGHHQTTEGDGTCVAHRLIGLQIAGRHVAMTAGTGRGTGDGKGILGVSGKGVTGTSGHVKHHPAGEHCPQKSAHASAFRTGKHQQYILRTC